MAPRSILVINPNSTRSMTDALVPLVKALGFDQTAHEFFTAPSGPKSINDEDDAGESAKHCFPALSEQGAFAKHDGFLVACYSKHPLVPMLKEESTVTKGNKPVTGIFEASVAMALQLIHPHEKFGIVSTGKVWEEILTDAVTAFLGKESSSRFGGVETTGLNATELHDAPQEEVEKRVKDATRRLLRQEDVGAVCLGCAGMSGMDDWVRSVAIEVRGEEKGKRVRVVDGVMAGVAWLEGAIRLTA